MINEVFEISDLNDCDIHNNYLLGFANTTPIDRSNNHAQTRLIYDALKLINDEYGDVYVDLKNQFIHDRINIGYGVGYINCSNGRWLVNIDNMIPKPLVILLIAKHELTGVINIKKSVDSDDLMLDTELVNLEQAQIDTAYSDFLSWFELDVPNKQKPGMYTDQCFNCQFWHKCYN